MAKKTQPTKPPKEKAEELSKGRKLPAWLAAILNPEMVSYERLPMLEVIFERLTRTLSTSLRNLTSDNVEVTLKEVTSLRFGDHLETVSEQALIGIFGATEWEGAALIIADKPLIHSIVNVFLGGRMTQDASKFGNRAYTTIERNLVKRLFKLVLHDLEEALEPLIPIKLPIDRLESSPRFATIVRPTAGAILGRLEIQMEGRSGGVEILIPYSSLESIRHLLVEMFMGEKLGHDVLWENHISKELLNTELTMDVILDEPYFNLGFVSNWQVGSTIPLTITSQSPVKVRCGDHDVLSGKMGQKNNNIAVFVDEDYLNNQEEIEHVQF